MKTPSVQKIEIPISATTCITSNAFLTECIQARDPKFIDPINLGAFALHDIITTKYFRSQWQFQTATLKTLFETITLGECFFSLAEPQKLSLTEKAFNSQALAKLEDTPALVLEAQLTRSGLVSMQQDSSGVFTHDYTLTLTGNLRYEGYSTQFSREDLLLTFTKTPTYVNTHDPLYSTPYPVYHARPIM